MTQVPLSSFLTTLADPETLAAFQAAPERFCEESGLSRNHTAAILQMHGGTLRVLAGSELEAAGLAPPISDKFPAKAGVQQRFAGPEINIYPPPETTTVSNFDVHTINYNNYSAHLPGTQQTVLQTIDAAIAASAREAYAPEAGEKPGRLVIVGTGIRSIVDLTLGAEAQIKVADRVFYTVADPVTELKIHDLNPNSATLYDLYDNDKPRIETYRQMVARMLDAVREGLNVCGVFYGHPGVFAWPTHEAVRLARLEGYRATMFPGISADACLFADLGIDPSQVGYQTFEATELLINRRRIDSASHVVIWQVECVGDGGFNFAGYKRHNFAILVDYLKTFYEPDHPVVVYEASMYAHLKPLIRKHTLGTIDKDALTGICSLYIPPMLGARPDQRMVELLGMA